MRKKSWKFIVLISVTLSSGLLGACSPAWKADEPVQADAEESESYYSFTDAAGVEIVLPAQPQRVAVLFSSFADVWQTAGGEIAVTVGESIERGLVPENTLLVDRGAGKTIDIERLVSYEPDFVICSEDIAAQSEAAELLNKAGIPSAGFHVESFDDYLNMLKICTDITGAKEAYVTYGLEVQKRIEKIKEHALKNAGGDLQGQESSRQQESAQPRILFIRAGSQYSATKAKTAEENFVCAMLKELGTCNIAEKAPILLDGLSLEEILLSDPDYIFISTMGEEQAARVYMDSVFREDGWRELSAVKNAHYYYLPKDLFQFKPNARWDEAYQYLADLLDRGVCHE